MDKVPPQDRIRVPADLMAESIRKEEAVSEDVFKERKAFADAHIARRLGNRELSLKEEWSSSRDRVSFIDERGDMLSTIIWQKDRKEPDIDDRTTPAFVLAANSRLVYSCARGERMSNDGSPAGKLASARSEVGGVMSTN